MQNQPNRCESTANFHIDGVDYGRQCEEWSNDPRGRHYGDHHAWLPPNVGGEGRHEGTWHNSDPPREDDAAAV